MGSSEQRANGPGLTPADSYGSSGEQQVIWVVWLTYGAFYFCRTNLSAALPGMTAGVEEGGLGLTGDHVGTILASLKIAYGIGQLVNGQLSERLSPRLLLAIGMFCSAALNLLFGFGTALYFLLFVWACNGYCQSLGWTPCVRVLANWVPVKRRGRAIGIVGTGYQVTLGLTYIVAGVSAELLGWRGALYVPAGLLAAAAVSMLFFLKESPDHAAAHKSADGYRMRTGAKPGSLMENLFLTIFNPALWLLAISLALLNACRYGFVDWGITHLTEVQATGVGKAALKYVVLGVGAVAGSFVAGWASDRFFGSRRAPVICILLVLLGVLTLVYESAARMSVIGTVFLLLLIGFCIFGPQVLLVGTAPADLARRGTSAAAAGFVNFVGYMGAAVGDKVTGYYKMPEHGGWQVAIYIWAGWAFVAAITAAPLWNKTFKPAHQASEKKAEQSRDC
ncbi:MFS transporter [Acidobacteria bacterium AH-259-G07]|nr:MFS transporter [Acidobacteria bacterium AH-259-G07]